MNVSVSNGEDKDPLHVFEMKANTLEEATQFILEMVEANYKHRAIALADNALTFGWDRGVTPCDSMHPHRFSYKDGNREFVNPLITVESDNKRDTKTNPEWEKADYECYFKNPEARRRTYYHYLVYKPQDNAPYTVLVFEPKKSYAAPARYYSLPSKEVA